MKKSQHRIQFLILLTSISILATGKSYAQETSLNKACREGDLNTVITLIKNGASANERNPDEKTSDSAKYGSMTPLISVVLSADWTEDGSDRIKIIRILLEHKADPNLMAPLCISGPRAAIHEIIDDWEEEYEERAKENNKLIEDVVRLFLKYGANPNLQTTDGYTPLHYSVQKGSLSLTKLLLDNKANPNMFDLDGYTPLHIAAESGNLSIAKLLIESGALVNERKIDDRLNSSGMTPLISTFIPLQDWSKLSDERLNIIKLLLEHKADPNLMTYAGEYEFNPSAAIHIIIDHYWESSEEDSLQNLYVQRIENVVRLLLKYGANPNLQRPDGITPLHIAVQKESVSITKLLLDSSANPNFQNQEGFTPLHFAAQQGSLDITKLLLEKGADVRISAKDGLTALSWVADERNENYNPSLESFYKDYLEQKNINITDKNWVEREKNHKKYKRKEDLHNFYEHMAIFLKYLIIYLILIGYVAVNIYLREHYFHNRFQNNWIGTFNSIILVVGGLAMLFGYIGIELATKNNSDLVGYETLADGIVGSFLGAVVGILTGILAIRFGRIPYHLKKNRFLYYSATTVITITIFLILYMNGII